MPPPARRVPFVGRGRELGTLLARLDEARAGDGGVALVAGEPGIGKTRLLAEFATRARSLGWTVLTGRAYETAGMPPYLPFTEALQEYIGRRSARELKAALDSGTADVARLIPHLRDLLPDLTELPALGTDQERYQLFEGISAALLGIARAGESGLLLILDDLHWADGATLALLRHLVGKLAEAPLYLALGYRTIDPTIAASLQEVLAEISRAGIAAHVPLHGFDTTETAALLTGLSGRQPAARVAAAVHAATEGSPFFVGELARHLEAEARDLSDPALADVPLGVPDGVRQVVGRRLSHLSPSANRALQVAAVLNDGFSFEVLQRASGLDAAVVLDVVDEALAAGMLHEEAGGFAFAHALIRSTLYDGLSLPRRQRLHLQAGEALEAAYLGKLTTLVPAIATHFWLAGATADQEKALRYTVQAARQAQAVFAFREAARLLEQALEIQATLHPEDHAVRCDLLLALCDAVVPSGDHQRAVEELLPEAYELAEAMGDHDRAAKAADRGAVVGSRLREERALTYAVLRPEWTERLDRHAQPGTVERLRADLRQAEILRAAGVFGEASRRIVRVIEEALRRKDLETLYLALAPGLVATVPATWAKTQKLALESAELPRSGIEPQVLGPALHVLSLRLLDAGEPRRAEALIRELETLAERTGDAHGQMMVLPQRARMAVLEGRFAEAEALCERMVALGAEHDIGLPGRINERSILWRARLEMGKFEAALRAGFASSFSAIFHRAVTLAHAGPSHIAEVLELLDRLPSVPDLAEQANVALALSALEAATLITDRDRLPALVDLVAPVAASCIGMAGLVLPARLLGEASALLGQRERARAYYQQALAAGGKVGFRPEIALTRLALAHLLQEGDADERHEAEEHLRFVIPEFEAMGMQPALGAALAFRDEMAAGASAPSVEAGTAMRRSRHPDGLTERQVEVLRLVAAGKSNQEIADTLLLSLNTVLRHMSDIFDKTRSANRTEAAVYAHRNGLAQ